MKTNSLALFFTFSVSLNEWDSKGLLMREKLIYEKLINQNDFDEIYWFTYGEKDLEVYEKLIKEVKLPKNIKVKYKPKQFRGFFGNCLYSFLLPFIHFSTLKKVQVLKTNQMMGSWTAIIAKIIYNKKLIIRTGFTQSIFYKKQGKKLLYLISRFIEKIAYSFSDYAFVASKEDYQYVKELYSPKNLSINYNYIDTDLFNASYKSKKNKKLKLVFIGRYSDQKNLFNLIDAVVQTNFSLDLYGHGELKKKIQLYIKKKQVTSRIKINGAVSNHEIPKLLKKYDLYVLTSLYEGMPKTLLEAMSVGKCCLGTNVAGIKEIIFHKKNGFLCEISSKSILGRIKEISSISDVHFNNIQQNARKTILNSFSLERFYKNELQVYKKIRKQKTS